MSELYTKTKDGKFIPVKIDSVLNKDMDNRLMVVRVGSDDHPATEQDLQETVKSFERADITGLNNASVIITPYQISVDLLDDHEISNKQICLQVTSGTDAKTLDEQTYSLYKKIKNKYPNTEIIPGPLKVEDYKKIVNVIKRSQIRRDRRGLARK